MKKTRVQYITLSEEKWLRNQIRKALLEGGIIKTKPTKKTKTTSSLKQVIAESVREVLAEKKVDKASQMRTAVNTTSPWPKAHIHKAKKDHQPTVSSEKQMKHKTNPNNAWKSKGYIKGDEQWIQHGHTAKKDTAAKNTIKHSENDDFEFGPNAYDGEKAKWYKNRKGRKKTSNESPNKNLTKKPSNRVTKWYKS